jgi:hypothetical protein
LNASFVSDDEESVTDDKDTDPDIFPDGLSPTREKNDSGHAISRIDAGRTGASYFSRREISRQKK